MSTQLPSLGKSFGAAYIGATVAAILFGITNLQAARYYRKYPNDWLLYRYSVAALWILDTIHVALTTHAVYFYLVDSFGNFPALTEIVWSLKLQYLIHILIVVGVQAIYAIRIWKLGGHLHRILPWIVFLAVAAVFGSGIYAIYDTYITKTLSSVPTEEVKRTIYAFFSSVVIADIIIAVLMCYYLYKSRATTIFSSTSTALLVLMRLVLISGVITSVFSLLVLISYLAWPDCLIFLAIDFILPKLYINSLLAMLNSRRRQEAVTGRQESDAPKVLRLPFRSSGNLSISPNDAEIPLTEIQGGLNHSKGGIDFEF